MQLLEAAWQKHLPGVDLEEALNSVGNPPAQSSPIISEAAAVSPDSIFHIGGQAPVGAGDGDGSRQADTVETESERAERFEWDESCDFDSITDGMGSLSVDPKGAGYMGPQSGNALLRFLQSLAAFFPLPQYNSNKALESRALSDSAVPEHSLSSSTSVDRCFEHYFKFYHSAYPILHEGVFRAQYMGTAYVFGPSLQTGLWY